MATADVFPSKETTYVGKYKGNLNGQSYDGRKCSITIEEYLDYTLIKGSNFRRARPYLFSVKGSTHYCDGNENKNFYRIINDQDENNIKEIDICLNKNDEVTKYFIKRSSTSDELECLIRP